jgi:glutathione S-transferase
VAIFPFLRQFAAVDANWFAQAAYPKLKAWLQARLESSLFLGVMAKA